MRTRILFYSFAAAALLCPTASLAYGQSYYQTYYQTYYQSYYQSYYQPAYASGVVTLNFSGDYTIDLWANPTSLSTSGGLLSRDTSSTYSPYLIYQNGSTFAFYSSSDGGAWNIANAQTICSGVVANTWYHLAVVRSGNTYSLYCNGARTTTFTSSLTPWASPDKFVLGRQYSGGAYYAGYIDEVRMSTVARWTGASFAVPTSEYASDGNTVLLLHMTGDKSQFYNAASGGYFAFTAPSGFAALSTANLPTVATTKPSDYFTSTTYTGNNAAKTITTGFAPDLVWIKNRVATYWNLVTDTVRGTNSSLFTNSTAGATANDSNGWLSAFGATGFTVGGQCVATPPNTNLNGNNYVAWAWKSSSFAGTNIVSYTGDGSAYRTVPHNLGTVPDVVIVKRTDQSGDWFVWSPALSSPGAFLKLNTADAQTTGNSPYINDLIPTMTAATTNGVTLSASVEYSSQYAWKAADKNTGTYWQSYPSVPTASAPQWLKVDFGAGNPQKVGAYTLKNYSSQNYAPLDFTFEGSNDNSAWTVLDTREWAPWIYSGSETQTFTVPVAARGSYRYYRINVTRTSTGEGIINELNLWDANYLPDATNFNVLSNATNNLNASGGEYVAYVFSNREGFQKTGTYLGNGSADGPFLYTGFKPKYVLIKRVDGGANDWHINDTARSIANPSVLSLRADTSDNEANGGGISMDMLADGFKLRDGGTGSNASGAAYLYIAFADVAFKNASAANGYAIGNSLRFDASRTAYLSKTFAGAPSTQKKGTISTWVKRATVGTRQEIASEYDGASANAMFLEFTSGDQLNFSFGGTSAYSVTGSPLYRDTSAWLHVVVAWDTIQPVASDRVKMYVNGVRITSFAAANYPNLNDSLQWAQAGKLNVIGASYNASNPLDGYLADFYYIDGQVLAPTAFGAFDGSLYWKPKAYTDVYGNNGFSLKFSDSSSLGADSSGRNNIWTPQKMLTYDQVFDTPTRNFAALSVPHYYSPTYPKGGVQGAGLIANGNYGAATNWSLSSGKWYWEYVVGGYNPGYPYVGVFKDPTSGTSWRAFPGHNNDTGFGYGSGGYVVSNSFTAPDTVSSFWNNDVIGVAYDADSGKVYFSKNGVWQSQANKIPTMTAATTLGVTMSASVEYSSNYAWRAGDQRPSDTYWYTYSHVPSAGSPDWLRTDFGSGNAQIIASYSIQNYYGGLGYDPINFTFEGSNDAASCTGAGAVWTVLDTETNVVWAQTGQVQYFPVASPASYRCYRVKVTGAGTVAAPTSYLIINQLGLYTTGATDPTSGTGYSGIVKNGTPGLSSYYGKTYLNFGQGGAPGITFTDSSAYSRNVIEVGNVVATSSISKFNSWGLYTDATAVGALSTPMTPGLNPAGDYTIDAWIYPTSVSGTKGIVSRDTSTGYSPYLIYQNGASITFYSGTADGTWNISSAQTICSSVSVNTWYHVAVVRSGNTYSLYCNGMRTTTFTSSLTPWQAPHPFIVGRQYNGGGYFQGYLDEVRFSNSARWTGTSFAVPAGEYSSDANTLLLLHMSDDKASHYYSGAGGYFAEPPPVGYKALSTSNLPTPAVTKPVSYFDAKTYTGNGGTPSYDLANKGSYITLSNSNFDATSATNCCWANNFVYSGPTFSSGKWYAEFKMSGAYAVFMGIGDASKRQSPESTLGALSTEYAYYPYGNLIRSGGVDTGGQPGEVAGDTFMVAVDMDAGKIWFGKNGAWLGTGNPSTGANPQYSGITGSKAFAVNFLASAGTIYANFGQSGRAGTNYYSAASGYFAYAPPTGFNSLAGLAGAQDMSLVFKPDLVWIKNRTAAYAHTWVDSVRGVGVNLFSNSTSAQTTDDVNGSVVAFNSPGFSAGGVCAATTGTGNVNTLNSTYAAWIWKKSPIAGVDIVSYTGDNALTRLISHSLGTTPDALLVKRTDAPSDWILGFPGLSPGFYSKLNATDAGTSAGSPISIDLIPVMTAATTNGVTLSASVEYSTNYAWKAGNKSGTNSYWSSYNGVTPSVAAPQWLKVDFGAGNTKTVSAYTVQGYYGAAYNYQLTNFTFEGSNDNSAWTVLDTQSSVDWTVYETKTFYVPQAAQAAYRYYRIKITDVTGGSTSEAVIEELNLWSATTSSSAKFSVSSGLNAGSGQYVAYLFSNREGFQKSGSYIGNGLADGPLIYTGFKPRYVMIKDISRGDSSAQWIIIDSAREISSPADRKLAANSSVVENDASVGGSGANAVEFLSNGFKLRSNNCATNCNQERFEYLSFAEIPFKTASEGYGFDISKSVRFDASLGSYLSRSLLTLGNRKTHTFSAWVKRGTLGSEQTFYAGNTGTTDDTFLQYKFNPNDQIVIAGWNTVWRQTYQAFRDTSKWYHIVVAIDTTQPAPKNRIRLYVDGAEITTFWCVNAICPAE